MIRNDFVSNSSSCSFIIHVRNDKDCEELKKKIDHVKKYGRYTLSVRDADFHAFNESIRDVDDIVPGMFILMYSGEDNCGDFQYEVDYRKMLDGITDGDYEFELFSDNDAHLTTGKDWNPFVKRCQREGKYFD